MVVFQQGAEAKLVQLQPVEHFAPPFCVWELNHRVSHRKGPKRQFFIDFFIFFDIFSIYLAASAAKYCKKGSRYWGKRCGKGSGLLRDGFGKPLMVRDGLGLANTGEG